jgi:hypothetical protein
MKRLPAPRKRKSPAWKPRLATERVIPQAEPPKKKARRTPTGKKPVKAKPASTDKESVKEHAPRQQKVPVAEYPPMRSYTPWEKRIEALPKGKTKSKGKHKKHGHTKDLEKELGWYRGGQEAYHDWKEKKEASDDWKKEEEAPLIGPEMKALHNTEETAGDLIFDYHDERVEHLQGALDEAKRAKDWVVEEVHRPILKDFELIRERVGGPMTPPRSRAPIRETTPARPHVTGPGKKSKVTKKSHDGE